MQHAMKGDLVIGSKHIGRAGFMHGEMPDQGFAAGGFGVQPVNRADVAHALGEQINELGTVQRTEIVGDISQIVSQLGVTLGEVRRALTSADVPIRENLEAPAISLVPDDTPLRNKLKRHPGSGKASLWEQLTSLGGGWGTLDQPGGGSATQTFYAEAGAPADFSSVYAQKTAAYKLLGAFGKVTNFAVAAGANYQDQLGRERTNCLRNLMLNEEYALIAGDATSTSAPWGDGTNALAFNGIYNLTTTANGVPSAQIQTSVGALTKAHIDGQLTAIWKQGGSGLFMLLNAQEIMSLTRLCEEDGSILRVNVVNQAGAVLGYRVAGYVHPVSGEMVTVMPSRFATAGTMQFGALTGPDGADAIDVDVLPQVPVPEGVEKPEQIQGYAVTDLARSQTAPDVHPIMVSVYEVLRMKNAKVFAKSTGVTAAT